MHNIVHNLHISRTCMHLICRSLERWAWNEGGKADFNLCIWRCCRWRCVSWEVAVVVAAVESISFGRPMSLWCLSWSYRCRQCWSCGPVLFVIHKTKRKILFCICNWINMSSLRTPLLVQCTVYVHFWIYDTIILYYAFIKCPLKWANCCYLIYLKGYAYSIM